MVATAEPRPRVGVSRLAAAADDAGSAVVEFVMVSVVLLALFLAILDLGLTLFVRNTLVATAAEGARYGANADRNAVDAADQTRRLLEGSLARRWAEDVTSGYEEVNGVRTVYVQLRVSLPSLGFVDAVPPLVVRGHAFDESSRTAP